MASNPSIKPNGEVEKREQQEDDIFDDEMEVVVSQAIGNNNPLLVEVGCGVGNALFPILFSELCVVAHGGYLWRRFPAL